VLRARLILHCTVGATWLVLSVVCLTRLGRPLAESLPFIAFDSNFAIVYSAAGRKADPEDPA
jgi:hypothetical protein